MMVIRLGAAAVAAAVLGLTLTGCGSSDKPAASSSSANSVSVSTVHRDPPLTADGPASGVINLTGAPGGKMAFAPAALNATTGINRVEIAVEQEGHNFRFLDPATRSAILDFGAAGSITSGRVFFPKAGDYKFACSVPGHAGMEGVVHVSGPAMSYEQAVAAASAATSAP